MILLLNTYTMKNKTIRNDLFLYDLAIRILAFWATILFSLLFFTGAQANNLPAKKTTQVNQQTTQTPHLQSKEK